VRGRLSLENARLSSGRAMSASAMTHPNQSLPQHGKPPISADGAIDHWQICTVRKRQP
jgi:hypothetical protein